MKGWKVYATVTFMQDRAKKQMSLVEIFRVSYIDLLCNMFADILAFGYACE